MGLFVLSYISDKWMGSLTKNIAGAYSKPESRRPVISYPDLPGHAKGRSGKVRFMLMRISGESRNPGHAAFAHIRKLLPFARGLRAKHKFTITVTWRLLRERQKKKREKEGDTVKEKSARPDHATD